MSHRLFRSLPSTNYLLNQLALRCCNLQWLSADYSLKNRGVRICLGEYHRPECDKILKIRLLLLCLDKLAENFISASIYGIARRICVIGLMLKVVLPGRGRRTYIVCSHSNRRESPPSKHHQTPTITTCSDNGCPTLSTEHLLLYHGHTDRHSPLQTSKTQIPHHQQKSPRLHHQRPHTRANRLLNPRFKPLHNSSPQRSKGHPSTNTHQLGQEQQRCRPPTTRSR